MIELLLQSLDGHAMQSRRSGEEIQRVVGVLEPLHILGRGYCGAVGYFFLQLVSCGVPPKKGRTGIKTLNFAPT